MKPQCSLQDYNGSGDRLEDCGGTDGCKRGQKKEVQNREGGGDDGEESVGGLTEGRERETERERGEDDAARLKCLLM